MAIIYDAYGNAVQSLDRIGGDTITDPRQQTQNIQAANGEVFVDLAGEHTVAFNVSGTFVLTLLAEASIDGNNYFQIPIWNPVTEVFVVSVTAAGNFQVDVPAGVKRFRLRCSGYTSGAAVVALRASKAMDFSYAKDIPASSFVTAVGAAAAAVTVSIPTPGIGLYNYLVWLQIVKFASAALTAGAAPVTVTTTNLTGAPQFSFSASADAAGTKEEQKLEPCKPVKSTASNTATTIVCPATTGVIWRVTAAYYIGA